MDNRAIMHVTDKPPQPVHINSLVLFSHFCFPSNYFPRDLHTRILYIFVFNISRYLIQYTIHWHLIQTIQFQPQLSICILLYLGDSPLQKYLCGFQQIVIMDSLYMYMKSA